MIVGKKTTLDEQCLFINGGAWNQDEYAESGVPVVQVTNMQKGTVVWEQVKYLPTSSLDRYSQNILEVHDLVIATVGSHPTQPNSVVGRATVIPDYAAGALLNQNAVCIRPKDQNLDKRYLGYLGKSAELHNYIISVARGAANQVRLAIGALKQFEFILPPLDTQRHIADILSAYDDLIANNNRRMALLEESMHLLYREWFVHHHFPGHEHTPIVDGVPAGWEKVTIAEICDDIRYGYTASANKAVVGPKFLRITDIVPPVIEWRGVPYCEIEENDISKYFLKEGDIVVARTGATTGYAKRLHRRHPEAIFASYLVRFRLKADVDDTLVGIFVESNTYKKFIQNQMGGAAQPNANATILSSAQLLLPPRHIQDRFREHTLPMLDAREVLQAQNGKLMEARDLLLPRLMNGAIPL